MSNHSENGTIAVYVYRRLAEKSAFNGEKAAAGGQRRKPRRIGALRLGDTLRAVSRHYTATLENKDEDKEAEFYSLSEGEEKASFYGMDVSVTGICIRKKKVAAI